jgi:hypothetical protein
MRWRGWFSGGRLLALLSVANLLLGVGLFSVRSPGRVERYLPTPVLPAQINDLIGKMDGQHRGQAFTLTLTNAELADTVAYYIAESNGVIPFSDVQVAIRDNRIVVDGRARGAGFAVPVSATLTVGVANGRPVIQVEQVGLGSVGLPAFVRDEVVRQANASLDLSGYDLGVTIASVELGAGVATVRGTID